MSSNVDNSGISLPSFPTVTNLKLHNIPLAHKLVKKVKTNLELSKASGPDCIPVIVLKSCEPGFSYILADLFNMCLDEFFFQIVGRPHMWSLYLRMLGRFLRLKSMTFLVLFL